MPPAQGARAIGRRGQRTVIRQGLTYSACSRRRVTIDTIACAIRPAVFYNSAGTQRHRGFCPILSASRIGDEEVRIPLPKRNSSHEPWATRRASCPDLQYSNVMYRSETDAAGWKRRGKAPSTSPAAGITALVDNIAAVQRLTLRAVGAGNDHAAASRHRQPAAPRAVLPTSEQAAGQQGGGRQPQRRRRNEPMQSPRRRACRRKMRCQRDSRALNVPCGEMTRSAVFRCAGRAHRRRDDRRRSGDALAITKHVRQRSPSPRWR